jgi:cell division septum initiation protein DivIVA
MTTIQERLRNPRNIEVLTRAAEDAADHIDALETKLETATEAAATYRKAMMELTAMLVESAAKVDALTKDAQRYQWLRANDPNKVMSVNTNDRVNKYYANELDQAVDAAIAEGKV